MSGTVKELSAMFVDKIILRCPGGGGWKTFRCSSKPIEECKGKIFHFVRV